MLRGGLILGIAALCACGSSTTGTTGTTGTPASTAGASAGGATAGSNGSGAGANQGGMAGQVNAGGAGAASGAAGSDRGGSATAGGTTGSVGCNTFANSAPVIHEVIMKGDPPAPMGGTITDGTYYETSYVVYTGTDTAVPNTNSHQLTAQISGTTFQVVFVDETGTQQRLTIQLSPNGTMLGEAQTCRTNTKFMMNQLNVLGYDATPTTLTIHLLPDTLSRSYTVYTLTKQ